MNDFWNEVTSGATVRIAVTGTLAILALFLLVKIIAEIPDLGRSETFPPKTIQVSAEGKAGAVPYIARLTFSVEERAETAAAAQDIVTGRTNKAITFLKQQGVAEKDIKTMGYTISPDYEQQPCDQYGNCGQTPPRIVSYNVSQSVEVRVRDTAKVGEILKGLGTIGVQNASGPEFTLDDAEDVKAQARSEAIKKAHEKAKVLARELGVTLGKVVSFYEDGGYYNPYAETGATKAMGSFDTRSAVAPSLPVGEEETNVNVTITYEIR